MTIIASFLFLPIVLLLFQLKSYKEEGCFTFHTFIESLTQCWVLTFRKGIFLSLDPLHTRDLRNACYVHALFEVHHLC